MLHERSKNVVTRLTLIFCFFVFRDFFRVYIYIYIYMHFIIVSIPYYYYYLEFQ